MERMMIVIVEEPPVEVPLDLGAGHLPIFPFHGEVVLELSRVDLRRQLLELLPRPRRVRNGWENSRGLDFPYESQRGPVPQPIKDVDFRVPGGPPVGLHEARAEPRPETPVRVAHLRPLASPRPSAPSRALGPPPPHLPWVTHLFVQLCINFANEKLHQFFLKFVFKMEEQIYKEEVPRTGRPNERPQPSQEVFHERSS